MIWKADLFAFGLNIASTIIYIFLPKRNFIGAQIYTQITMEPSEPPPPYEAAAASSSSTSNPAPTHLHPDTAHKEHNGIPPSIRRSMEDEHRDLPTGWVRQYDAKSDHQFFVDTNSNPPRSIWHHPYDDEQYLSTVSPSERARIHSLQTAPSQGDNVAEGSGDDHYNYAANPELPPRPEQSGEKKGFGRKLKDKLTNSTHEEREAERRQRDEEERRLYEQHQKFRQAMSKAAQTGEPQFLGKDRQGKDVYVEPPYGPGAGYGRYGQGAYGYNPYAQGPYANTNPNARFVRPPGPYSRPFGYGYGGGMGIGAAPLLGLGGGLMLGGLFF
jgi:hypothetical protein